MTKHLFHQVSLGIRNQCTFKFVEVHEQNTENTKTMTVLKVINPDLKNMLELSDVMTLTRHSTLCSLLKKEHTRHLLAELQTGHLI